MKLERWLALFAVFAWANVAHAYDFFDSLRGGSAGNPVGGQFGPDGWTVTSPADRIWYALPRLVQGSIEFTIERMTPANFVRDDNELLTLYEAGYGMAEPLNYNPEYRGNHYKIMVRVYGPGADADRLGVTKLMWGLCPSGALGALREGALRATEIPGAGRLGRAGLAVLDAGSALRRANCDPATGVCSHLATYAWKNQLGNEHLTQGLFGGNPTVRGTRLGVTPGSIAAAAESGALTRVGTYVPANLASSTMEAVRDRVGSKWKNLLALIKRRS